MSDPPSRALTVTVSLEASTTSITGLVHTCGQPERSFTGWIGLFEALRTTVQEVQGDQERGGADHGHLES